MLWQSVQCQIEKFSQILQNESANIEEFAEHPRHLTSLSKRLTPLKIIGTKADYYVEEPTSGESSPCLSESGKTRRYKAPSVLDMKKLTNNEDIIDLDYDIEKFANSGEKYTTLFFEGLNESMTVEELDLLMDGVKINNYEKSHIFALRNSKFLNYKEKRCLALKILVIQPKIFARFIRKFQMHFKNSHGYGIGISIAKIGQRRTSIINGVVLRNIPPTISHDQLRARCSEHLDGTISLGPIQRIKDSDCCLVECDYLEDAEVICKKINKTRVRDTETKENYVIKVVYLKYPRVIVVGSYLSSQHFEIS